MSSRRTASAFSASLNGNEAISSIAAVKSVVVSTVAGVVAAVFGFDFRAFRPPPSARFADTFFGELVQAVVQAAAGN